MTRVRPPNFCGESRRAFDGAGTGLVFVQQVGPITQSAIRRRSACRGAWDFTAFQTTTSMLEFNGERLDARRSRNVGNQRQHVFCGGGPGVHKEIRMGDRWIRASANVKPLLIQAHQS